MGFLSAYDGTQRIPIPHPDKDYWVDLKKHLSLGATEKAASHLQRITMVDGKACPAPDVVKSQQERVLAAIVGWNLDDDNGTVWPVNAQSLRRLPDTVFDQLLAAVEASNAPATSEERRRFPDAGVGGDPNGDGGPGVPADVSDGAAAVAAPWPAQGGPFEPTGA